MEAAEQPPKKRKLYDSSHSFWAPAIPSPPPPPPQQQQHPQLQNPEFASPPPPPPPEAPPLSQEEILQRRRNREEIRSLNECYRRIRFCVSKKDAHLMPELEQAYLSLITASRGCTSVQRIVAELIPRYASFCPTALEAAAKVSINMYNWNLAVVMIGEDVGRVSFQTAKTCILGLVDICRTASYEAPTSSVIQGICDAVFQIVLTFFVSSFEGKDIYQICSRKMIELQDSMNFLDALKQCSQNENEPALDSLFELRALCLLCIFFSFPKNLLSACFQLFTSAATDGHLSKGKYFLKQVTSDVNVDNVNFISEKIFDGTSVRKNPMEIYSKCEGVSYVDSCPRKSNSCFMAMVINRDSSLRSWIISKYKKLCTLVSSPATSDVSLTLEKVLGSLTQVEEADLEESDGIAAVRGAPLQHDTGGDASGDVSSAKDDSSRSDAHGMWSPKGNSVHESEELVVKKVEKRKIEDVFPKKKSSQNESTSDKLLLDTNRKTDSLSDLSAGDSHVVNSLSQNSGKTIIATTSSHDKAKMYLSSRKNLVLHSHTSSQPLWFFDEDSKAVDVVSASKQLWLSSLGCEASEISVRSRLENFGPLEQFWFIFSKDFALVRYRNILDAVKARELMQGCSIWGGCLNIEFLNIGLGNRRYVDGIAVTESHCVYIGKVQQLKDEILHELSKVGLGKPHVVTEFRSENGFLLDFSTAEEAAMAIWHIRNYLGNSGRDACPRNTNVVSSVEKQLTPRISSAVGSPSQRDHSYGGISSKLDHPYNVPAASRPDLPIHVPLSPKINLEGYANQGHYGQTFHSRSVDVANVGSRKNDDRGSIVPMDLLAPKGNTTPKSGERVLHLMKQDNEPCTTTKGSIPQRPVAAPCGSIIPPPVPMPFIRPVYFTPTNSWDSSGPNLNRPTGVMPNDSRNIRPCPPVPFIPCSVTPLSQLSGTAIAGRANVPPPPRTLSEVPLPLKPSPPPLPLCLQPPIPPPTITPPPPPPPPQPFSDSLNFQTAAACVRHLWQGNLTKSGVLYCRVYASREESFACKYLNAASEPTDWPARLDVTKRADFQHVKTTFTNTPSNKREVCRLLPLTTNDQKGVHDFTSYLIQRECAGVIKIPAGKFMWARLLFILPYSAETCTLLGIKHHPAECLIALVLPKETAQE